MTVELFAGASTGLALWVVAAFVVTFVVTRVVVRMIRAGRGPFRDTSVGDVHVHHHVYGIFLMLLSGAGEFVYRPGSPWVEVLAVVFGAGAALTLDEFALWLHLDDVYWAREGRKSVDAVLVAAAIGAFLVLGARPFDDTADEGRMAFAVTVLAHLVLAGIAIFKGKIASGLIGIVVPFVAVVAAVRLARPGSPWARARYDAARLARAETRFRRNRWDGVKDLLAGAPTEGRT
ncbi:phosphoethanolamine transferase CptA [Amycolatopsis methanolica]|uniref:Integral membrane protein n=1 Tax=Amycolatopsis methanolica 239 TaxID=1068978 RepID=A0A076MPC8_AMYME|nr:phosphoethanolamine transferase CptA [Amycolatopsis methanolica]AIJ20675.1 integral membrane protein [Amycolatopsis methanolica 239]